jgi:hypothetical protein
VSQGSYLSHEVRPYRLALRMILGDSLSDNALHVLGGTQGEPLETLKDRKGIAQTQCTRMGEML